MHIDRMRAIAVLCMVEVHTAAIIPPKGMTVGDPAAFVAAAFGGMAAPMFVMISGWGIHMSAVRRVARSPMGASDWISWLIPRVLLLTICQLLVNVLLNVERGGRFEWHTPGVLSLLAIAALLAPVLVRLGMQVRIGLMLVMVASPLILGDATGLDWTWWERVSSVGASEWVARLLWNGTYPAVPWLFFVLLGTLVYDLSENTIMRERNIAMGLAATTVTIVIAVMEDIPWALTEGEAVLTFFPASPAFLVVSGTFALLAHRILEGNEASGGDPWKGDRLSFLEPLGKITLTVYVAHFAVLGVVASMMQGEPRLELIPAFAATISHTLIWIPIAIWHQKNIPEVSLESLLRRLS
ncbi:MAG: acyltransferase family protein [Candidatus Thermoplasmatota archaeon]|nr:acyltransferase family protein [Candidatus Thermoplasmatota archaeon]